VCGVSHNGSIFPFEGYVLIYLAGPLFSVAEREYNERLTTALETLGHRVFLPQRDGAEADREPYRSMSRDERRIAMFNLDRDMVLASEVFLFVLDGRVPDEGACVELGIAYCHRLSAAPSKRLLGLQTDTRGAFLGSKLNPMIHVALDAVLHTEDALIAELAHTL